ncbi:MAG: hypothetical protein AB7G93_01950 [Bdellovibrionales bacterium]
MNWLGKLLVISAMGTAIGCGVRGDPLPPERPPDLGRGRPTYKRATEGIPLEKQPPRTDKKDEEKSEDDGDSKVR